MLFCVANAGTGGGSILVDGLGAAEALRRESPAAFALLTESPVDFRFHDRSCDIRHRAPTIALDADGNVTSVRFNNWLRAALDVPEDRVESVYRALCRFWRLLREPRFQIRLKLSAGDMVSFDNARVLHGREPFDPNSGARHLQGGYLDRDLVMSRLRLLARES
jgi:gamma-butyrobetaine dioxygenase